MTREELTPQLLQELIEYPHVVMLVAEDVIAEIARQALAAPVWREKASEVPGLSATLDEVRGELTAATSERDEARMVGEAVLSVLRDFGWDHAVLRAAVESDRLADTVEGCILLAVERAIRAHAAGSATRGGE